jgi:DNA-binding response OmpR family regulator
MWQKPCDLHALKKALNDLSLSFERQTVIGTIVFLPAQQMVKSDQGWHHLTFAETRLLSTLVQANGKDLTKDYLLKTVWRITADIETRTLEEHVYRLRRKLEPRPSLPRFLLSTPGGYMLRIERREKFPYKQEEDREKNREAL